MTSFPSQHQPTDARRHRLTRLGKYVGIAIVASLLAACADETTTRDDRRFANEPSTENAITAVSVTETPINPAATPVSDSAPASPESMLTANGAPDVVFDLLDGAIVVIDAATTAPPVRIAPPEGWAFSSIAPSPVDDRVAALVTSAAQTDPGMLEVALYDREGSVLDRWTDLPGAENASATPVADGELVNASAAPSITWEPASGRLLVAPGGAELLTIDTDGQATVLPVPSPVQRVEFAAWSPQDDQIALLARDEEGGAAIWVYSPYVDGVSMRQVAPPNADASNLGSVTKFRWLHDGSGLAYILSESSGMDAQGGQLYTINLKLGIRLLVATAGRGGPAAEIVDFVPSPDGQTVAYEIAIPDSDGWQFHSIWVRPVQGEGVYNIPVDVADGVDDFWWAGNGLVSRQSANGVIDYVVNEPGLAPTSILTIAPGATPVAASPVANVAAATPTSATPIPASPAAAAPDSATPVSATPPA